MGLNIVAHRKYSLKGFAEGWDDAYIMVRAANEQERKIHADKLLKMRADMNKAIAAEDQQKIQSLGIDLEVEAEKTVRQFALDLIEGGKVVTTNDDGTTELVAFDKSDAETVVNALGFAWVNDLVTVATGADRLKAPTTEK